MTRGFTLIETIIYLALLSLIIACSFAALGSASDSAAASAAAASALREGTFAVGKIEYALARDPDAAVTLDGATLVLAEDGEALPLTSAQVTASALDVRNSGEGREVSFLINGIAFTAEVRDAP